MKAMQSGDLDQRVTFQRRSRVSDGGGGYVETWADYHTCSAKVSALSGRERDMANQTEAPRNYRLWVRRDSKVAALTEADIVVWRGKTMQVRFIADQGPRHLYMQIDCEAGVSV